MGIVNNVLAGASGNQGYFLSRSLRFRSSASALLSRNQTNGSQTTWTWSGWVKRGIISSSSVQNLFGVIFVPGGGTNLQTYFTFANDNIEFVFYTNSAGYVGRLVTTQVFRDPSAWYHIVAIFDTTNATASNRMRLFVNGSQITAFSTATYPTQNSTGFVNNSSYSVGIGQVQPYNTSQYFDGYMAEINFIDGQALTPSSFGMNDPATGVWEPKKYTGTYGTNGFYLPFTDNSNNTATTIGKDFSGNGNNWTPNNISVTAGATYDSMTDVPTLTSATAANYAVLNPVLKFYGSGSSITQANLNFISNTSGVTESAFATIPMSSGKWYAEVTITAAVSGQWIGVCSNIVNAGFAGGFYGVRNPGYAYRVGTGNKCNNDNTGVAYAASSTTNDIIGIAMDADAGSITFYKNGVSLGVAFTGMTNSGGGWIFGGDSDQGGTLTFNFGQRPFAYTPPSGFVALNTFNLPTPTIGATPSSQANKYFDATLYTGTSASQSVTNSGGFQPDLVWLKNRNYGAGTNHVLIDSVRGVSVGLASNLTNADFSTVGNFSSINSNGFTVTGTARDYNFLSDTFVGWQWRASGSTVSNTAGSITSTVSANTTAGFSIVTYTGNGTAGATVGHGLGVAPNLVIWKKRSATSNWYVWSKAMDVASGSTGWLYLNLTSAKQTSGSTNEYPTYKVDPTSTLLTLNGTGSSNGTNDSTATMVAYCFAQVAGYSAFGSYTGNGSADGPFVFLGFRPRYVMFKRTDAVEGWYIYDTARTTINVMGAELRADSSAAEADFSSRDFLSNGFKIRTANGSVNANGGTYIYMAFAENPFKFSLAR